ncbi:rod shape-determining protein MreC [Geminocystis sp. NIES-3709]|uniref:rod shape-determining protein MreC n=1 Tax=Geminocystis sp. NIES-3709 TaxID=1617448 RepID=UPI0005FC668C|nr:rod shape-determining protein MreC [Geminocystis sp. NIES-3709]BAQ64195.1 rod shape-determining protein MreC [Geminocystis sp. NIES-3709]
MKFIYRWWQKYGSQLVFGLISIFMAWLVYYTQGALISETLYRLSPNFLFYPQIDRQALYEQRTIQELSNKIVALETENQNLKKIVKYQEKSPDSLIPARVIGRSADAWWQIVVIDVGSSKGVKPNQVVMSVGGLVGKIIDVTPNTSRVLLISDYNSRVGATITRKGYQGFIKGQGTPIGLMEFYAKVADVKIGEVVTTSNISSIFPPDIPIGKVTSIDLNKSPAPEAQIEFTAPIDFLDWVVVDLTEKQPLTVNNQ